MNNIFQEIDYIFEKSCSEKDIDNVKKLYDKIKDHYNVNIATYAFREAVFNNQIEIAKWLLTLDIPPDVYHASKIFIRDACNCGNLDMAKLIYNYKDYHIFGIYEILFRSACLNGHLDIVKWLYSLDRKPKLEEYWIDELFSLTCIGDNLDVLKWLYSLEYRPDLEYDNDAAFRYAVENKQIEVAKWLTTLCDNYSIEIEDNKIKSFRIDQH